MQERRPISVSELTAQLRRVIEPKFVDVWVEGEVSNFVKHSSGHWYFTLKDRNASLNCMCYRSENRAIRFLPEDGLSVRARGRISVFESRGAYRLVVDTLEPVGAGALQLAFEQLKKRLAAEGLFDQERKRKLPILPGCIGVVTSPTGSVVRDILRTIKRRNEAVSVLIAPARVQGDGAALEIAAAIDALNSRPEVDVIIVGRGGGSIEDLWCFNEETVARAIYRSRAPLISAVGHETDYTIADFVADLRASTPSAAAEMVAVARDQIGERLKALGDDLASLMRYRLLALRKAFSELESSRALAVAPIRIGNLSQRIDSAFYTLVSAMRTNLNNERAGYQSVSGRLGQVDVRRALMAHQGGLSLFAARLPAAARGLIEQGRNRLSVTAGKLDSLSPLAVLGRGYAIAFDARGAVIRRALEVRRGDSVRVRVSEGEMNCVREDGENPR
jgi:exodeoxyribonuclease VII large subunit